MFDEYKPMDRDNRVADFHVNKNSPPVKSATAIGNYSLNGLANNLINSNARKQREYDFNKSMQSLRDRINNINISDISTDDADSGDINIYDQFINGKMYNPYTKIYGTQATRHNNPGNISGVGKKLLYDAVRIAHTPSNSDAGDRAMQVYKTPEDGWRAMYKLMNEPQYNNAAITQAFSKYQRDKKAWGRMVDDLTKHGINPNINTFNKLTPAQQLYFMQSRARHEGWKGIPVTLKMIGY